MMPKLPEPYLDAEQFYDSFKKLFHDLPNASTSKVVNQGHLERILLYYSSGGEVIRVGQVGYQKPNMIFLGGRDSNDDSCYVLAHPHAVQLILKYVSPTAPADSSERKLGFQIEWLDNMSETPDE